MKLILYIILLGWGWQAGAAPAFVDAPLNCFAKQTYPCVVRSQSGFLSFEKGPNKFHLAEKAALLLYSDSEAQLLQGEVWVKDSHNLIFRSSSALKFNISGEWFFQKQNDKSLLVRNLSGDLKFDSKYVFASESLPVGFQNWFAGLGNDGQILRGVIRPITVGDFLRAWLPVSGYSMAEARKATQAYRQQWGSALEKSAKLYQDIADRRLASRDEKKQLAESKRQAVLRDQEKYRRMFRERNGLVDPADH